jgi:hypothetical protein
MSAALRALAVGLLSAAGLADAATGDVPPDWRGEWKVRFVNAAFVGIAVVESTNEPFVCVRVQRTWRGLAPGQSICAASDDSSLRRATPGTRLLIFLDDGPRRDGPAWRPPRMSDARPWPGETVLFAAEGAGVPGADPAFGPLADELTTFGGLAADEQDRRALLASLSERLAAPGRAPPPALRRRLDALRGALATASTDDQMARALAAFLRGLAPAESDRAVPEPAGAGWRRAVDGALQEAGSPSLVAKLAKLHGVIASAEEREEIEAGVAHREALRAGTSRWGMRSWP